MNNLLKIILICILIFGLFGFQTPNAFASTAQVFVQAGGGGGGGGATTNGGYGGGGGGGGAGGYKYNASVTITNGSYTITIGAGGSHGAVATDGSPGNDSTWDVSGTPLTATAGGYGGHGDSLSGNAGGNGGSGGGAGGGDNGGAGSSGGTGTGGQGFNGGNGDNNFDFGGGGGGASAVGHSPTYNTDRFTNGGDGIADASVGNLLSMASAPDTAHSGGGGGGGQINGTDSQRLGGAGGGGNGGSNNGNGAGPLVASVAGTANTGGGGGGGGGESNNTVGGVGADGGSGIVIVAFTTAQFSATGGNATGTSGSLTWVKFTASGTLTLSSPAANGKPRREIIRINIKPESLVYV